MNTNETMPPTTPAWELTLSEFLEQKRRKLINTLTVRILPSLKKELANLRPRATRRKKKLLTEIALREATLRELETGISPQRAQQWQKEYEVAVAKAISRGEKVGEKVIDQKPEFNKAMLARLRYEKGKHTSFANQSTAVDSSPRAARGYKAKRQDGKPIIQAQLDEIAAGFGEIEAVIGSIRDILFDIDVTVAHTNGKMPFMRSSAAGLYSGYERIISMGANDWFGQRIPVQGHEVAHLLDIEAGKAEGKSVRCWDKKEPYESHSLAEWDNRVGEGSGPLIYMALQRVQRVRYIESLFHRGDDLSEAEKGARQAIRFVLSSYWRRPREIWARLFEQYISTKLAGRGRVAVKADYTNMAGYWVAQDWAFLEPMVEIEINRRLDILRRRIAAQTQTGPG